MDTKVEKLELIRLLLQTKKVSILTEIKKIFEQEKETDFYYNLTEAQKASIERGLLQIEKGEVISHNEVKKLYEKWL